MRKLTFVLFCSFCHVCAYTQIGTTDLDTVQVFASTNQWSVPEIIHTPFDLVGGLIFVEAEIWGSKDSFIFDTGASSLILNTSNYLAPLSKDHNCVSTNSEIKASEVRVNQFDFQGLGKKNFDAYNIDVSHLESIRNRRIAGFIGQDLLCNYEVMFDYKNQEITLFKRGTSVYHKEIKPIASIPFTMEHHFPVLEVKIGKRILRLGLDSGAEANVIDIKSKKKIKKEMKTFEKRPEIHGFGKEGQEVSAFMVESLKVKKEEFTKQPFVLVDISKLNDLYDLEIDGLLGFPFLSQRKFSINYYTNRLYIWDVEEQPTYLKRKKEIKVKKSKKRQPIVKANPLLDDETKE